MQRSLSGDLCSVSLGHYRLSDLELLFGFRLRFFVLKGLHLNLHFLFEFDRISLLPLLTFGKVDHLLEFIYRFQNPFTTLDLTFEVGEFLSLYFFDDLEHVLDVCSRVNWLHERLGNVTN